METALQTTQPANLSTLSPSADEWKVITEQAEMLIKTKFLPQSITTAEQAVAIILQGRELGIPTMAALGTINVIQQKPTVSPQLMLALINRSGQLENFSITNDDQTGAATCTMKRRGRDAHTEIFGAKEAAAMKLNDKDNYKKQAPTMYRWRAVAACARVVFPDVILGIYTPDEMGAENINVETGELIPEKSNNIGAAVNMPTKSNLVNRTRSNVPAAVNTVAAEPLNKQLADLCGSLNKAFEIDAWTPKHLTNYARAFFEDESIETYKRLDEKRKTELIEDLQAVLEERIAINSLEESGIVEAEVVEPDAEQFEKDVF